MFGATVLFFMKKNNVLIKLASTCFYIGYLPIPGTITSLAVLVIYLGLIRLKQYPLITDYIPWMFFLIYSVVVLMALYIGFLTCGPAQKILGKKDDSRIVIDEAAGMLIALWAINPPLGSHPYIHIVIAFVLFRFFDILKPYPLKKLESLPGGIGVMADDIAAGIYANILTRIVLLMFN